MTEELLRRIDFRLQKLSSEEHIIESLLSRSDDRFRLSDGTQHTGWDFDSTIRTNNSMNSHTSVGGAPIRRVSSNSSIHSHFSNSSIRSGDIHLPPDLDVRALALLTRQETLSPHDSLIVDNDATVTYSGTSTTQITRRREKSIDFSVKEFEECRNVVPVCVSRNKEAEHHIERLITTKNGKKRNTVTVSSQKTPPKPATSVDQGEEKIVADNYTHATFYSSGSNTSDSKRSNSSSWRGSVSGVVASDGGCVGMFEGERKSMIESRLFFV